MRMTCFFLVCCCCLASSNAFQRVPPLFTHQRAKKTEHHAAPDPSLLLPVIVGTTGLVFFLFNGIDVNSKVDLTDQGLARAKAKRYAERKEAGKLPENTENLDPYRWFADEDEPVDLINPPKKGGGCG